MAQDDWVDPELQNATAYDNLRVAIEASQGALSLLLAVCDDERLRNEIIARYQADLAPDIRCYQTTLIRGEPSLRKTIAQLVEANEYLQQGGQAVITVTGTEQLYFLKLGEARSEQEIFLGYLQWTREALRDFHFPIVLWMTYQTLTLVSQKSPDFWSWRKGVFRFAVRKKASVPVGELDAIRSTLELERPDHDDTLLPLEDLKALIDRTEQQNPQDPLLATLYNQMGRVYGWRAERGDAQDYAIEQAQAIAYFEKAVALQTELEQESELANSVDWLAGLYDNQGRYEAAEPLYVQALALRKRLLGEEHPDVATSLNNLAGLYDNQGRYEAAEPLYVQALALNKRLLGEEHPDVATSLNNLAVLYKNQGRYEAAEPLYLEALAIDRRMLPADHPDLVIDLVNLANLYRVQKRWAEAEPLYSEALQIRKKRLGADHPKTIRVRDNLRKVRSHLQPNFLQRLLKRFTR